jgi:hypothetical protein
MKFKIKPGVFSIAALFSLLSSGIAAAQTVQTNVMYICHRECMLSPVEMKLC